MYHFLNHPNRLIWNTRFPEAEEYLEAYRETIPAAGLLYAETAILHYAVTGERAVRDVIAERIGAVLDLVKRYTNARRRPELARLIAEANENCPCPLCSPPPPEDASQPEEEEEGETSAAVDENLVTDESVPEIDPDDLTKLTDENSILPLLEVDLQADRGLSLLFKGLSGLMLQSYVAAGINMRKSWKTFESIQSHIPHSWNGEAYVSSHPEDAIIDSTKLALDQSTIDKVGLGVGVFLFLISVLPDLLQKVLSIIGFSADRDRGVALLHSCSANPKGFTAGFSSFLLAVNYLFIPRGFDDIAISLEEYEPVLRRALATYPSSAHFEMLASQFARKGQGFRVAIQHLENAIDSCADCGIGTPNNYHFELGHCLFAVGETRRAIELFEPLSRDMEFNQGANAAIELAICQSAENFDHLTIVETLERARVMNSSQRQHRMKKFVLQKLRSLDSVARDKVAQPRRPRKKNVPIQFDPEKLKLFLEWSGFESLYLRRDLAHLSSSDAKTYLTSFEDLASRITLLDSEDINAGVLIIRAELMKRIGIEEFDLVEIRSILMRTVGLERQVRFEKQWIVSAMYELGEMEFFEGKYEIALEWMGRAKKFGKYPFEEVLKARIGLGIKSVIKKQQEMMGQE